MGTPIKWPRTPSSLKVSSLKSSSGAIVQVPSSGTIVQVPSSGTKFRHHSSGAKFRHQVQVPSSDAKFRCQCFWILARPDPVKLEGNPSWNYFPPLPPNYQNPITINLGPVLCKVSWMFEFSIFLHSFWICWPQMGSLYNAPLWISFEFLGLTTLRAVAHF